MKTITEKKFDAVKYMREQRKMLSEKFSKMNTEEIIEYLNNKKLENKIKPSA